MSKNIIAKLYQCEIKKFGKAGVQFLLFLSLSIAALILAEATITIADMDPWLKVAAALAHIPFTILAGVLGWRYLKGVDELQRLIHMQAFIISVTAAGAVLLSYSLLMSADLVSGEMTWLFWSLLWVFYSFAYVFVSRRY